MGEQIIPEPIGTLPIVEMKNNEAKRSDLIPSLRSKIDVIDILTSGFANNIEDFSELFWVVKDAAGMGGAEFQDFIANINRTKKLIVGADDDVSTHRIEIPHEARGALIKLLVEQIVEETGIMDVRSLTGSSLTNVAIKASTMKLRQRVADFEWGHTRPQRISLNCIKPIRTKCSSSILSSRSCSLKTRRKSSIT